jgi:hypothetical protein
MIAKFSCAVGLTREPATGKNPPRLFEVHAIAFGAGIDRMQATIDSQTLPLLGEDQIEDTACVACSSAGPAKRCDGRWGAAGCAGLVLELRMLIQDVLNDELHADVPQIFVRRPVHRVVADRQIESVMRRRDVGVVVDRAGIGAACSPRLLDHYFL